MKLIPKYQQGFGIVPVGYTPLPWTVTATSGVATTTPDTSTDNKTKKDPLLSDTIVNSLKANALTSDMEFFLERSNIFRDQIFSGIADAGRTEERTKELLLYATRMENEKKAFDQVMTSINTKNAENEIAISAEGYVFTYSNGVIKPKAFTKVTSKDKLLTNAQLANYRANDPKFAFNSGITTTLGGATSFKEIRGIIDAAVDKLGQTGTDEENYYGTKNGGGKEFLAGLATMGITRRELAQIPADKLIEVKLKGMDNAAQIEHAFNSVKTQLSPQQRVLLSLRAKQLGLKDADAVLLEYLHAKAKNTVSASMDIINLKDGTKGSNRTSSDNEGFGKLKLTPGMEIGLELGRKIPVTINTGTKAQTQALGTQRTITSKTGENIGQKLGVELLQSSLANNLQLDQITMGGERIPEEQLAYTFIKNGMAVAVNLPIDVQKYNQGIIAPDLELSKKVQNVLLAHKEAKTPEQINKVLEDAGLPAMYKGVDQNGNPILDATNYQKFVGIDVIADSKSFGEVKPNESLVVEIEESPEAFKQQVANLGKNIELSDNFIDPNCYGGTMYIPFDLDSVGTYAGFEDITVDQALQLRKLQDKTDQISSGAVQSAYNADLVKQLMKGDNNGK